MKYAKSILVIPAQAGPLAAAKPIHGAGCMDSRLRGNDSRYCVANCAFFY
jgi:hypothetical protein